ncbi:putative Glycosyltransferase-like domain-containing protein 1 [Monocercomonoides exilis]|uniref:putative Glycosyltransferase-like domain-containing protein 1 n=1 Tax=Monocercomonoides exilis TaxID=2049356 RepID=UPI0035596672|nr:putative Glycosyltransferase-like domain-containing protein 1 [Monocercomonoides exilis]|eukprot:MONOS_2504.1-p1 / transcript=MONOS_2504.1 / gene=MONOS_2504 / organism=Monocercomonoides_exilis_PA203 / gene_product=Glycosyltransferase-like domain-containing protein 1 / transcript_product=Glycosyltransferase-like domain-containing protein 1 / location=Mono_scaffold00052:51607-53179(-) / protein_length=351 / sequence_SO=supercontig / SO=protein_coding / is_pseudo=false
MDSFYGEMNHFLKRMPEPRPQKDLPSKLREKSSVLYYPLTVPRFIIEDGTSNDNSAQTIESEPSSSDVSSSLEKPRPLRIVTVGRWEHDKDPETLFRVLNKLADYFCGGEKKESVAEREKPMHCEDGKAYLNKEKTENESKMEEKTESGLPRDKSHNFGEGDQSKRPVPRRKTAEREEIESNVKSPFAHITAETRPFELSILGCSSGDYPLVYDEARIRLAPFIVNFGNIPDKDEYWRELQRCDVVVSTAVHEFFGVGVLEAVSAGCVPLCPNRLSYTELFPKEELWNTDTQLFNALKQFVKKPWIVRKRKQEMKDRGRQYHLDRLTKTYIERIFQLAEEKGKKEMEKKAD